MASPTVVSLDGLSTLVNPAWTRGPIDDKTVEDVLALIDRFTIIERIQQWRAEDAGDRHAGGRPSLISDRSILALFWIAAIDGAPLLVTSVTDLLNNRLSPSSRQLLGIFTADDIDYSAVWRATQRFLAVIDGYHAPTRRRYTRDEAEAVRNALDPQFAEKMDQRARWVNNQMYEMTWQLLPRDVRRKWKGNIAIDATVLPVLSSNRRGGGNRFSDPFAGLHRRSGGNPIMDNKGMVMGESKRSWDFGYELHLAVIGTNDPHEISEFPFLIMGSVIARPGTAIGESAIALLTSLHDRGHPKNFVVTDRAYFSGAKEETLQLPSRLLGYKNANDYKVTELGIQESYAGAVMVEGSWYCPSMPETLINATIDYLNGDLDNNEYQARIDERRRYQLHHKTQADAKGNVRLQCPAVGVSATASCPLRPASMRSAKVHLRARIRTTPTDTGPICTQNSVTFPVWAGAKYRQDLPYQTPEWRDMYATLRNTIEGFNGYMKDSAYENLEASGRRRMRGRTAQFFLSTLLIVAANIRRIRAFLAERSDPDKIARLETTRQRKRTAQHTTTRNGRSPPSRKQHVAV